MPGDALLTFDTALCEYALGQVRSHLLSFASRPTCPPLTPVEWDALPLADWAAYSVSDLPADLASRVWAGVTGDVRPLTDNELFALASAFDLPPMRLTGLAVWLAWEALPSSVRLAAVARDRFTGRVPVSHATTSTSRTSPLLTKASSPANSASDTTTSADRFRMVGSGMPSSGFRGMIAPPFPGRAAHRNAALNAAPDRLRVELPHRGCDRRHHSWT